MVFYSALGFSLVTGSLMLFYWVTPELPALLLMITLGCVTLVAQYSLVNAYQFARVHIIAPFEYITVLWAVTLGWLLFDEQPGSTTIVGACLIIVAGLSVCWYEKVEYNRNTAAPINPV